MFSSVNRIALIRLSALLAFLLLVIPGAAQAQNQAGGFEGPGPAIVTVAQVKTMKDDAHVALKGRITQRISGEVYLFEDASGTLEVEIDDDDWRGVTASPTDTVIILGEVDKEWNKLRVDVDSVVKQ